MEKPMIRSAPRASGGQSGDWQVPPSGSGGTVWRGRREEEGGGAKVLHRPPRQTLAISQDDWN